MKGGRKGKLNYGRRIKIGLVTTPLSTGHAVRGVGFYTRRLLENLELATKKTGFGI